MELDDLHQAFLSALYKVYFVNFAGALQWDEWAREDGYSEQEVDNCFDALRERGFVEPYAIGRVANLTSPGVLFVEEQGLFDREVVRHQQQFRTKFLVALAEIRDQHGFHAAEDWQSITSRIGAADNDFLFNYKILTDGGYIDNQSTRSFFITSYGYKAVEEYREATKHQNEFEQLQSTSALAIAEREAAFLSLMKSKCVTDGWQCELVALEVGSEERFIFYRDLNFFVSECMWRNEALSRNVIRQLREQVASRPGTYGCVFSMSPISADAISEAQMHLEAACIIIFGEEDLAGLFSDGNLTDTVNAKMVNARIRRSVQAK